MAVPFVYHRRPPGMAGTVLYPLNQLRTRHPAIYDAHVQKYAGREQTLERRIPLLDCCWTAVLLTSPIHPAAIFRALAELGLPAETSPRHSLHIWALEFVTGYAGAASGRGGEDAVADGLAHLLHRLVVMEAE